ncbi:MAG: redox-sensing transcriptional repressor Rex [Nitriliruptoraceae bacterium]
MCDGIPTHGRGSADKGDTLERKVPEATVTRLPLYLKVLVDAAESGIATISSDELARAAGLNSAKVRKDLSFLGTYGTRGVGYHVAELTTEISQVLGLTGDRRVIIVGVGNLGRALASYTGFDRRGFEVVALLDADPSKVGTRLGDHVIEAIDDVEQIVAERHVTFAVISTPADHAQRVVDHVTAAGVTAILNFAPVHLEVDDHVSVRTVDLSTELQILSFYEQMAKVRPAAAG